MLKSLKELFDGRLKRALLDTNEQTAEHAVRLATAALLVETAKADFEFDLSERQALQDLIQRTYELSPEETSELLKMAESEVDVAISLDRFTSLLDRNLNPGQKLTVMKLLWELAYADGRLDKYEEYLIRKLADLLHVPHRGFIQAKLAVTERLKSEQSS